MISAAPLQVPDLCSEPVMTAVIHTLMYFDVFRHPLTTDEVYSNCHWHSCSLTETAAALETLQSHGIVGEEEGFWFLAGNRGHVQLRIERQERAIRFQRKAKRYSKLIAAFPFVRGVCISGSLSKGTMDKDGDIDYFIITEPGRLWIARTLLVLFKKIFLLNSKKYFCVNYFIDTNHLSIPDRNLFVATEIAFLKPMDHPELYRRFMKENHWTRLFYPNREACSATALPGERKNFLKRNVEKLLSGKTGEWLDEKFLKITLSRWQKKFGHISGIRFEVDFRSRRHVSKHHPNGFQSRVQLELEKRRNFLLEQHGVDIPALRWEWRSAEELIQKVS